MLRGRNDHIQDVSAVGMERKSVLANLLGYWQPMYELRLPVMMARVCPNQRRTHVPVLKSLSFTALPKPNNDIVQIRRANFVAKLEEQKLLLKDPNHIRTTQRWTKVDGERQAVTRQQAVRPWWKTDPSGQVVMSMKFGSKPIEFEKGKAGIVVGTKEKLPAVIDALIAAVRAGELDDLFGQAAKTSAVGKSKKAA